MPIRNRLRPLAYESLPEGYTRCEYLESTGTQYIATGIEEHSDSTIWGRFQLTELSGDYKLFGGAVNAIATNSGKFRGSNTPTTFDVFEFESTGTYKAPVKALGILTNLNTKETEKTYFWCPSTPDNMYQFSLFRVGYSGLPYQGMSRVRIFAFKAYRGGGLEFDCFPALDPTGKPCMFDLVSRTPFYNQTTTGPDFLYKTYSYPFNPPDNWHSVNRKVKEIVGSTKYTLEFTEVGK